MAGPDGAHDDRYLEYRANSRLGLARQALIYGPIGVFIAGLLVVAVGALPNSIIGVVILLLFGIPVMIVGYQAVADLAGRRPITSRGVIDRQFSKGRFLIFGRVNYLLADMRRVKGGAVVREGKPHRRLFEIGSEANDRLSPGDEIEVVHWPHTNHIVSLEKIASGLPTDGPDRDRTPDRAAWDELDRGSRTSGWPHQ